MTRPLSDALRWGTADARGQLERAPFLTALVEGAWGAGVLGEYARALRCVQYLGCVREVYLSLEAALWRQRMHPLLRPLPLAEVRRSAAIAEDLERLAGRRWRVLRPQSCAAARHASRVRVLSELHPGLLVAHAYAAAVCEAAAAPLPSCWGAWSYRCPLGERGACPRAQAGPCPVTQRWAGLLDSLPLAPQESSRLVREARLAFGLRAQLCAELAQGAEGS